MLRHLQKLKRVRFIFSGRVRFDQLLLHVECAALVKQGKVYGVGTEDMDVKTDLLLILYYYPHMFHSMFRL